MTSLLADDDAVKAGLISNLTSDTATVIVGHFTGVNAAGAASGYDVSFPAYKAAIEKFDTSVGEILAALKNVLIITMSNGWWLLHQVQAGNIPYPQMPMTKLFLASQK